MQFSEMWSVFFSKSPEWREEFRSDFDHLDFIERIWNLNKILNISGNIDKKEKADHIIGKPIDYENYVVIV